MFITFSSPELSAFQAITGIPRYPASWRRYCNGNINDKECDSLNDMNTSEWVALHLGGGSGPPELFCFCEIDDGRAALLNLGAQQIQHFWSGNRYQRSYHITSREARTYWQITKLCFKGRASQNDTLTWHSGTIVRQFRSPTLDLITQWQCAPY